MLEIQQDVVARLRKMASLGIAPSRILRELLLLTDTEEPRSATLVWYLMNAFGLEQHQAAAVFGWNADGSGELSDTR